MQDRANTNCGQVGDQNYFIFYSHMFVSNPFVFCQFYFIIHVNIFSI